MTETNSSNEVATESVVPGSRVRSRLAWFGSRGHSTPPAIEPLLRALRANHPKADTGLIVRAYEVACIQHTGQLRHSGEPFVTHPVAVATILAELGMTPQTLAAALLHDTVEDTPYTLEKMRADFGGEIALLVDGVTKLDKLQYGDLNVGITANPVGPNGRRYNNRGRVCGKSDHLVGYGRLKNCWRKFGRNIGIVYMYKELCTEAK